LGARRRSVASPDRYQLIATGCAGRALTRHELIEVLVQAGYTPTSASGRISQTHPLITHIGPNLYRLIERVPATKINSHPGSGAIP